MGIKAMLNAFRARIETPVRSRRQPLRPSPESLETEAELSRTHAEAVVANNRASMGVVLTAARAMHAESGIQAMLRGMLDETDRGRDHHGRT